jgi:competence ComEA-like helix-hairpin-helix protein
MNPISRLAGVMCGALVALVLLPLIPALAGQTPEAKGPNPTAQELPPGEGKALLLKQCSGCHQLTVVTSQHKSESAWTDTIIEMRNRGANGSDEDMEQIIHYLAANFGPSNTPAKVNVNSSSAPDMVAGLALSHAEADAIVAYRSKNGKFKDIAGLKQVPAVDVAKIDAARDRIEF